MKSRLETKGMNVLEAFIKYFGASMALIYMAAGIFLLLKADSLFDLPEYYSVPLGIVLTFYGAFRAYHVYKKYFENRHEDDN
jgi:hypothetical protein